MNSYKILPSWLLILCLGEPIQAKDIEPTSILRSLAFEGRLDPRSVFATDAEFFLHIAILPLNGAEQHFYASQWRREGFPKLENAAVFQSCMFLQQEKRFDVRWKQLEPEVSWLEFLDSLKNAELYKMLGKFRHEEKVQVADGVTIEVEVVYKRTHIRTTIRNPIHDKDVLEYLSRFQRIFGFEFRL